MSTGIIILVLVILLFSSILGGVGYWKREDIFDTGSDTGSDTGADAKAGTTRAPDGVGEGGNQLEKIIGVNGEEQ
jgi:hypothetical protein